MTQPTSSPDAPGGQPAGDRPSGRLPDGASPAASAGPSFTEFLAATPGGNGSSGTDGSPAGNGSPGGNGFLGGGPAGDAGAASAASVRRVVTACLAAAASTVLLGAAAGLVWSALAPRPQLIMTGPGGAAVINVETTAFIAADGWYGLIGLIGGAAAGLLGYWLAVRRHGPAGMATVLVSAVGAGVVAMWIGQQIGLAHYRHLLATLPAGAHLQDALMLGSRGAIAFWPLAAGLAAGGIVAVGALRDRQPAAGGTPAP